MKKKQAVLSVLLIFLFAFTLLCVGLTFTERSLRQVSGRVGENVAIALSRDDAGAWVFTFAGRTLHLNREIWQVFRQNMGR
ncbi:MAG: hypothetical protein NUK65_01605 [Firmicutes bacterium]|nr:hypothetical protein [Bacillota bacterium]